MDYSSLIDSWKYYLELEEVFNLEIKVDSVKNYQLYCLNKAGSIIISEENKLKASFHSKELIDYLAEQRNNDEQHKNFYLLFPLIEKRTSKETKFCPLFVFPFSEKIVDILMCKVEYNIGKDSEQFDSGKDKISAISNEDAEIKWYVKEFNLEDYVDYIPCRPVFRNILNFDEEEFDIIFSGKPFVTALRELLDLDDETTFEDIYKKLKIWCENRLEIFQKRGVKVSFFDFLILDENFNLIQNEKIKKQLSILQSSEFDPIHDKDSPAYEYLYGEQKVSFDEYNIPSEEVWLGTFHKYPLSPGQALLLQKYATGEKLIAAQGPPGTGKTTVLMALIAHTLTQRALSIAKYGVDYSSTILISSTANKAVTNTAREFKREENFKGFEIYENGGFYFSYVGGQKSEDFSISIARFERLKKHLEDVNLEEAQLEFQKVKKRLLSFYDRLHSRLQRVKNLKEEYQKLRLSLAEIDNLYPDLDNKINNLTVEIQKIKEILWKDFSYSVPENVLLVKDLCNNHKDWLEKFRKSSVSNLDFDDFLDIVNSSLEKDVINLQVYFKNRTVLDKIINIFTKKEEKMLGSFLAVNSKFFKKLQITHSLKKEEIINSLDIVYQKIKEIRELVNQVVDEKLVRYSEIYDKLIDFLNLNDELGKLNTIKQTRDNLLEKLEKLKLDPMFKYVIIQDGVFELWRKNYYLRTRAMFLLSMKFLQYYAYINSNEVIRCLELFIQLFSQDSYRAKKEITGIGVEEFYRLISLVCPIFLSSLNSSPFLFDKFIYQGNGYTGKQQEFLQKKFKPIYLLFIDEAGMATPHLSYPAIYWSNFVVCVGDPLQLEPVVPLDRYTLECFHEKFYGTDYRSLNRYSPALISVYHRAARCETGNPEPSNVGQAVFLDYHRRCQPLIANLFCKIAGYKKLYVATPLLEGGDKKKIDEMGGKNLIFYDVKGLPGPYKNTNLGEVFAVKAVCKKLEEVGYNLSEEVGIITPYVNQEFLLQKELKDLIPSSHIGTIHKFQGSEFSVIIMSSVVFRDTDSVSFIDGAPNLLNVAVSRAKRLFILVGSYKKLMSTTRYFSKAIEFIKNHGIFIDCVEFDETPDRLTKKREIVNFIQKSDNSVSVLHDVFSHIEYFKSIPQKAKNRVIIVSPWIKADNLKNFSFPILKNLANKNIKVNIIYGYSVDDILDSEVEKILRSLNTIVLKKMSTLTHSKIIVVDDSELVVSSLNWLSHSYYKYLSTSNEVKAFIRNEVGLVTNNQAVINKILKVYNF